MEDATVLSPERPHNFHLPFDMDGDGDSASSQALCEREESWKRDSSEEVQFRFPDYKKHMELQQA
uniref:Uncharacterized protein n=1 Tax=Timema tahoe TaxID=61484 RepID=A0A7R9I9I8_9NEOP|nr:unnamed protein product [Timema tahoe]